MNIDVSANPVRKINPAVLVLRADRATVKKYAVHSHLDVRLSAQAARELRDQAHGRLGLLLNCRGSLASISA